MVRMIIVVAIILQSSTLAARSESFSRENSSRGELWLKNENNEVSSCLVLKTDVSFKISGLIARAVVKQTFENTSNEWMEGIYVFPLPENAAVDHLRMRVGERQIEGQIKERHEAKKVYLKAKHSGKKASLVEQQRPNIFTASVANIEPGGTIEIEIEYQHQLDYVDQSVSMRFPLVVAPRYIPGLSREVTETISINQGFGWANDTDQVPDASRITPPVRNHNDAGENNVSMSIRLKPGFTVEEIKSHYHPVDIIEENPGDFVISLKDGAIPANRDFLLVWKAKAGNAPQAAAFVEQRNDDQYSLLMLVPPKINDRVELQPLKEVVFVIDTSGSMYGESIKQAKNALRIGLRRLDARDTFNIIEFNSDTRKLFTNSRRADQDAINKGLNFIDGLDAEGGTEMLPALELALSGETDGLRLRQLIFLTDGAIGNEREMFSLIDDRLGHNRLFTVGIGSAPNSYFMRKAAQFGRGTFTYIGDVSEVQKKLTDLFTKIESPLLTDIKLNFSESGFDAEIYPSEVPDLYENEPLLVSVRSPSMADKLIVTEMRGAFPWKTEIAIDVGANDTGVAAVWARSKIGQLMDDRIKVDEPSSKQLIKDTIIAIALDHYLVTRFSSLVAVDVTPARLPKQMFRSLPVKSELPKDWNYEKVFGVPQTATPGKFHLLLASWLFALSWIVFRFRAKT